jgi:hypothetical protein
VAAGNGIRSKSLSPTQSGDPSPQSATPAAESETEEEVDDDESFNNDEDDEGGGGGIITS